MSVLPAAIYLMGPTAVGKTALALELHESLPVEIISVDASQVYRGMDIGTAKPTRSELARAPHRLIDIRDPSETYSAAEFCQDALREMQSIAQQGKIPLLVGGTVFYFHALEFGLSALPSADTRLRARLKGEAEQHGWDFLHQRLEKIDPVSAQRIHAHDTQRILRALEVYEVTGRSLTEITASTDRPALPFRLIKLALWPTDRKMLHHRIELRFNTMLERGFIAEVEKLYARGDLEPTMLSLRTVGYRQVWKYLTNKVNHSEMRRQALTATRQFAKRQLTWLRRYPDMRVLECADFPPVHEAKAYLEKMIR